ncbi:DUF58 domain-containing protein [Leeuwenhoekiella polynyae]|uniref:DUF58 domain-containing protein n=1 Tax=Leeuwenhoekiella polynyae TaxID=1550906 RepID=A0A4Q0PH22_9FLAO|nr:DUF58 domain-containing protein [Leeuwenhoekiella polynyae]RXG25866.1 putative protein DUF58 [Leeuwenhoekiella polynyae]
MDLQAHLNTITGFNNLELLAGQIVEGFISGMHKSPFHGFSAEFAEHKVYNAGESTKHIDWRLYARTDKLYTKRYEEETNLRCHLIVDNSSSMHYPALKSSDLNKPNKIAFSVLASAAIMQLMKKQRDAVGLSVYAENFEFYAPEKGSERHHHMLLDQLNQILIKPNKNNKTDTYANLHFIAEKLKRRSLVFLFSDLFQNEIQQEKTFEALQHLKYNKHEVVLFHTYDSATELNFDFDSTPKRFEDIETGKSIDVFSENLKDAYYESVNKYFSALKLRCAQYNIKYVSADIQRGFAPILSTFLVERRQFL